MPLMIKTAEEGVARPVIVCDHCGQEIAGAGDGNVVWTTPPPGDGPQVKAQFAHKTCCAALEGRDPHRAWGAVELDSLLVHLAKNLNLKWETVATQGPVFVSAGMTQRRPSGLNATHVPADLGDLELDGDALEAVLDGLTI